MRIAISNFSYNQNLIFEGLDFNTAAPISVLTGPSGCGKTTFLKIVAGVTSAEINFKDYNFQDSLLVIQEDALLPWLTGEENLSLLLGEKASTIKSHPLFPSVNGYLHKRAFEMSYGQRRLLEIFRALTDKPSLLLLDEPFNFLDKSYRELVIESLVSLSHNNTQIIFSSHYKEDISELSAKIFYLDGQFPYHQFENQ